MRQLEVSRRAASQKTRPRPTKRVSQIAVSVFAALLLLAPGALADRTHLKPGWNMFSPQQDVQIGASAAKEAKQKLPLCNDQKVDAYLTQIGKRLAAKAPTNGAEYPWEFHCVNDKAINAFALPGGYVFVNRGTMEAADTEAQLAGVMAHELSHVALRHGTNQASKAQMWQGGIGILGGVIGGSNMGNLITQLGSLGAASILLKYSRTAETQADVMGTQILYDAGYDPRGLTQFFEKLQEQSAGKNPPEFFSDHPNPEHRVERVQEEIDKLGGPPPNARRDSQDFQAVKREVLSLPAAPKANPLAKGTGPGGRPAPPSDRYATYDGSEFTLKYPENWKKYGEGNAITLAPDGGIVQDTKGQAALAYGMTVGMSDTHDNQTPDNLDEETRHLIEQLQHSNPRMRAQRKPERVRLNGQPALSTYLTNDSPVGGQEIDWVVTTMRPEGLLYFVGVAPDNDFRAYEKAFNNILDSVRLQ